MKDFVAKADVRYFLILASFVMYMASMSAPEWTVERTDDNANSVSTSSVLETIR